MTGRPIAGPRGLTLVELMISVVIMMIAIMAAAALIIAGSNMTARAERRTTAEDSARDAMELIGRSLANAGMGAPGGLYIWQGGANVLINPVFGTGGGASGVDDLWLVVPDRNVLREPSVLPECISAPGSATTNLTNGTDSSGLRVSCITGFTKHDTLLVTNWNTGALIFNPEPTPAKSFGEPAIIQFPAMGTDFSNAPGRGDFKAGDLVFRVKVIHYFVRMNSATGRPVLYMARGAVNPLPPPAPPFFENGDPVVVQDNIEDLQITYEVADNDSVVPGDYGQLQTFPAQRQAPPFLRSLTVRIVGITPAQQRMANGAILTSHKPIFKLADHENTSVLGANADGYERVMVQRRFELPNLSPSLL
jgi:type II secretory pathway pseudopilin PulG